MSSKVQRFVRLAALSCRLCRSPAPRRQPATMSRSDEIVVTAQKREESLRDVPLSVEAVTRRQTRPMPASCALMT